MTGWSYIVMLCFALTADCTPPHSVPELYATEAECDAAAKAKILEITTALHLRWLEEHGPPVPPFGARAGCYETEAI